VINAEVAEHLARALAIVIGADDASEHDPGTEGTEESGDAAGTAEAFLTAVGLEQQDGRFLADAGGVAPDIAVKHDIADDEDARLSQVLNQLDQFATH
jgi:hypothetical protein